jgi:hypothetical protein
LYRYTKSLSDRIFEKDIFDNHPLASAICKEAADISTRAIAIKPNLAEAHLSLGAALGRLAMWSDNREKVRAGWHSRVSDGLHGPYWLSSIGVLTAK